MRRLFLLLSLLILLVQGCGTGFISGSSRLSSYAARASWQWENTEHFLMRGRARLEGENQVFSGPFILWASKSIPAVRADFCGPDGSPLISLLLNSDGCLLYQPQEAHAEFFVGGMPAGRGLLDVYAVISLIRTGFPQIPVQWEMVSSCDTSSNDFNQWLFTPMTSDTAVVCLKNTESFPSFLTDDFSLEVTVSSWHEEFNAWPMEWRLRSSAANALIRIRSYDVETDPQSSVWNMVVPIPVDTLDFRNFSGGLWKSAAELPIR